MAVGDQVILVETFMALRADLLDWNPGRHLRKHHGSTAAFRAAGALVVKLDASLAVPHGNHRSQDLGQKLRLARIGHPANADPPSDPPP